MTTANFNHTEKISEDKVSVKLILETSFSKEIQILMKKGQTMKEHTAPFPIVIHLLSGEIKFGVSGETHQLKSGDILTLESKIPHDLFALSDATVRLTLSKKDQIDRVQSVAAE